MAAGSIRSWTQIGDLFVSQFRASIAYAPPENILANIKQKDNETLKEYFKRFNDQVRRMRQSSKETLKNFLIMGVRLGTDFWKELQGREPETLSNFYANAKPHKVVEEFIANLAREHGDNR